MQGGVFVQPEADPWSCRYLTFWSSISHELWVNLIDKPTLEFGKIESKTQGTR